MEVSSGRNSATKDFAAYRALHQANSRDRDVTRRLLDILRKDLNLAGTLAGESGIDTPILDAVAKATSGLTDEDLYARWRASLGGPMPGET
jgi:hypothetical protein